MLAQCDKCGVGFDPKLGKCVNCGQPYVHSHAGHAPNTSESYAYTAFEIWQSTKSWPQTTIMIEDQFGLTPHQAVEVIESAQRIQSADAREAGFKLALAGLAIMICAVGWASMRHVATGGILGPGFKTCLVAMIGLFVFVRGILKSRMWIR